MNYNAEPLELYCQTRFYGPLVIALHEVQDPNSSLINFRLQDLDRIKTLNVRLKNKNKKDDTVLDCLIQEPEFNENLSELFKQMESFTFYMFKYKSAWCPERAESHDSKNCVYAHHMRDFRRPPSLFEYSPDDCEHVQGNVNVTMCPNGLLCPRAHTAIEKLYHPDSYKRKNCEKFKCNKKEICAFNHNSSEKNHASKMAKKWRKDGPSR